MNTILIYKTINKLKKNSSVKNLLIGFDGFVDEIIHVVDKRKDNSEYSRIHTIKDFAQRIAASANFGTNIELVSQQKKIGGNGPILANALLLQKHNISYWGALGKNKIHPIFEKFVASCDEVISFADPGHTDALEFFDGKVMLGKISELYDINLKNLTNYISPEKITETLLKTDLIAFTNWTMLPGLNSIMQFIFKIIKEIKTFPYIFIDLADPQKRTSTDISELVNLIKKWQNQSQIIFGLNELESKIIADILKISEKKITERAEVIRNSLEISFVLIHSAKEAVVSTESNTFKIKGPFTNKPKLTTGAGDNFNAGFCHGILSGLEPAEALMCGVCTSGFYVRKCYSPTKSELIDFMERLGKMY